MSTECAFSEPSILGVSDHTLRGYIDESISLSLLSVCCNIVHERSTTKQHSHYNSKENMAFHDGLSI